MEFDLFKLHDFKEDIKPRSWIRVSGSRFTIKLQDLIYQLKSEGYSINQISKIISKDMNINQRTVNSYFNNFLKSSKSNGFIPLVILDSFIKKFYFQDYFGLRKQLIISINYLKCGAILSKKTKAVKCLSCKLSEIAGAHAADGTLIRYPKKKGFQYRWVISDNDKNSLVYIKNLIKDLFNLNVEVKKSKYENSYIIVLDSKVIVRYLNKFLNFKYGNKTETVSIPAIIKSKHEYKKHFLKGFLTFDGSVDIYGYVRLSIKNKTMMKELSEIFKEEKINIIYKEERTRKGVYSFRINVQKYPKLLDCFLINSNKWLRLKFFISGYLNKELTLLFRKQIISKISLKEVLLKSKKLKIFTFSIINKFFNVNPRTLRAYLRILENANIINKTYSDDFLFFKLKKSLVSFPIRKNFSQIYIYNER